MLNSAIISLVPVIILSFLATGDSAYTRCFVCRSRGDLGDCKDPFSFNDTSSRDLPGNPISVTPCTSGWCQKKSEGIKGPADEYGAATERACLSQAPSDGEERCAEVKIRNKITRLCFCRGDLCNQAGGKDASVLLVGFALLIATGAFLAQKT